MKKDSSVTYYQPSDLAKEYHIHPNTIRMYEKLGFITSAVRGENGYRYYTRLQLLQVKMCRCIFGHPFTNHKIRAAGNKILYSAAKQDWNQTKQCIETYRDAIEAEIVKAKETAKLLLERQDQIVKCTSATNHTMMSEKEAEAKKEITSLLTRKKAADFLGVTVETVRNWERNGLIYPYEKNKNQETNGLTCSYEKNRNQETCYSIDTYKRMQIIYMLRQAGYSMQAIHRSMKEYEQGNFKLAYDKLQHPDPDSLIWVGDQWLLELNRLLSSANELVNVFHEIMDSNENI